MSDDLPRRRFLLSAAASVASMTFAETPFSAAAAQVEDRTGHEQSGPLPYLPTRHIKTDLLDIGYHETGPENGHPVILLHGFPYDIHSYVDVAPMLAGQGYRVIVPHLRGHGTTRFLSA